MPIEQDIQELKKHDWDDPHLIAEWEKALYDLHNDIEYLKMEQTQRIVNLLRKSISLINDEILNQRFINDETKDELNQLFCLRESYSRLIAFYKADDRLEDQKANIESQIANALTRAV